MAKKRGARSQQLLEEKLLREQRAAFVKKFGREPGPKDPVFFDPDKDEPTALNPASVETALIAGMKASGVRPELIYAYEKTGLILMEGIDYAKAVRKEYEAAIDEYFELEQAGKLPSTK